MGAIYVDPARERATIDRDECVECYACYNGMSQEHLNPALVRAVSPEHKPLDTIGLAPLRPQVTRASSSVASSLGEASARNASIRSQTVSSVSSSERR